MATTRVFWSGKSQAVRLPKEFRLKGKEVEIFRRGRRNPSAREGQGIGACIRDSRQSARRFPAGGPTRCATAAGRLVRVPLE
jgi:hypothetical protein